jgi:hypothetical protein
MRYRNVTKADVGKEIECRDTLKCTWQTGWKLNSFVKSQGETHFIVEREDYWTWFAHARIAEPLLPDGWLPDDWFVLEDNAIVNDGDLLLFDDVASKSFHPERYYRPKPRGYIGSKAGDIVARCTHHLCVIRPRWRPATKEDVGKSVHRDDQRYTLAAILAPDTYGIDCVLSTGFGYRFERLEKLKVENEGYINAAR